MEKLLNLNIKEIFKLLATETVSTQVLLETTIKQIKKASKFNAFITLTQNEAEIGSKKALDRYKNKAPKSEIDGLPIALKDNFCTNKIRTTCASKMLENFVPTYNATVYQKLKDAGALLVGKTNMDQFAMGSGTVDGIFGPCKNPYGFENGEKWRISGGSSGGSAVAVATGSCFGAIGSDTGGSTRNPASYCGLVGLKPTYGLVSRHGLIPLVNSMDVPGILTKSVDDCASILNIVAGHDCKDSTSLTRPYRKIRLPPAGKMSLQNLKIGIPKEYHCEQLCPEILEIWNDIALLLQENGAIIKQVSLPHTEFSIVCYSILNQCEVASNMARYDGIEFGFRANENDSTEKLFASTRSLGFNEVVRNRILTGNYFLLKRNYQKYFEQALKVRRLISNDFDLAWENVQLLLTPTTLTEAPFYNDFVQKTNRDQCALQDYCTQPANMAGIPAISIPIKLSKNGLPLSLQLMGRNLSEPMLLAVAKFIENAVQFRKNQKMFDQP